MAAFITAEGVITATAHLSPAWVGFDLRRRLAAALPGQLLLRARYPRADARRGALRRRSRRRRLRLRHRLDRDRRRGGHRRAALTPAGSAGPAASATSSSIPTARASARPAATAAAWKPTPPSRACSPSPRRRSAVTPTACSPAARPTALTPQLVCEAARDGDEAAICVFAAGRPLPRARADQPDQHPLAAPVVVGGGIALAGDLLLEPARQVDPAIRVSAGPPRGRDRAGGAGRSLRRLRRRGDGLPRHPHQSSRRGHDAAMKVDLSEAAGFPLTLDTRTQRAGRGRSGAVRPGCPAGAGGAGGGAASSRTGSPRRPSSTGLFPLRDAGPATRAAGADRA